MSIWVVDTMCALLVVLGIALVLKRPAKPRGSLGSTVYDANNNPQTYILRIAGVTLTAFGFALGLMATVFHFT